MIVANRPESFQLKITRIYWSKTNFLKNRIVQDVGELSFCNDLHLILGTSRRQAIRRNQSMAVPIPVRQIIESTDSLFLP